MQNHPHELSGLDPQVAIFLQRAEKSAQPALYMLTTPTARLAYAKNIAKVSGEVVPVDAVYDTSFDSRTGAVAVRVYRPTGIQHTSLPTLIFIHGGGWSFGSIETHDHICRRLCAGSDCIILSIDYHLAPECKFPAAVNDAIDALHWVRENAARLGVDLSRLAIGGDSAGATLATVACFAARDSSFPALKLQLLIYPATDLSMSFASHREFGDGYRLTRPLMTWSTANYLRKGEDLLDPRASPLFSNNLADLPPAVIITAGFDPLRDEGAAYAQKLRDAGTEVQYKNYEGMIHGFLSMPGIFDTCLTALDDINLILRTELVA